MTTSTLTADRLTHLRSARTIIDGAKSSDRDLTDNEVTRVETHLDAVKTIDRQVKGIALLDSVVGQGGSEVEPRDGAASGSLFSAADQKSIVAAAKSRTNFRGDFNVKAAITGALLPTSGTYVEGGLHPSSQFPLASLFGSQPADGPSVRYYRTTSGAAAVVAEGGLKPSFGIAFEAIDVLLTKLACTAQFTDELAEDAPFLLTFLQQELIAAVVAAENKLIIDTFAATSGVLTATGAGTTIVDMLADSVAAQQSISGSTPTAILANPSVVATIRKSKATTSGTYVLDVLSAGPTMIHGVPLISSPAVPAAIGWVAVSSGVTIFRRGGSTVEIGTNADDWSHNTRTARAEERLAVGVTRPSSLSKLVLT